MCSEMSESGSLWHVRTRDDESEVWVILAVIMNVIQIMSPSVSRQLSEVLLNALNQNLVQFTLRPGVQVTVYAAHLSAGNQTQLPGCVFRATQEGLCIFVVSGTEHKACRPSGDLDAVDSQVYYIHSSCCPSQLITPTLCLIGSPPCSYTETFREWASLQVCVPLPIGDAATVLKGLIR